MKKTFVAALCVAIAGGLLVTAASGGATTRVAHTKLGSAGDSAARKATRTYTGSFLDAGPNTEVILKASYRGGRARKVKSFQYEGIPADCDVTGENTLGGIWTLFGVKVNPETRKFKAVGDDGQPNPSSINLKGQFNRRYTKVRGTFQTTLYFADDGVNPEETCRSEKKDYVAKK